MGAMQQLKYRKSNAPMSLSVWTWLGNSSWFQAISKEVEVASLNRHGTFLLPSLAISYTHDGNHSYHVLPDPHS